MSMRAVLLACALALPATAGLTAEQYRCPLINTDDLEHPRTDASQYVDLSIDGDAVGSVIHITDASKDLTFQECRALTDDGSNFTGWFRTECRGLAAADGGAFTVDPTMIDAYAGISPPIDAAYGKRDVIADVGAKLGLGTPPRTFVIYSGDRRPAYEFFCYAAP